MAALCKKNLIVSLSAVFGAASKFPDSWGGTVNGETNWKHFPPTRGVVMCSISTVNSHLAAIHTHDHHCSLKIKSLSTGFSSCSLFHLDVEGQATEEESNVKVINLCYRNKCTDAQVRSHHTHTHTPRISDTHTHTHIYLHIHTS